VIAATFAAVFGNLPLALLLLTVAYIAAY